jgi:beta-lactamase regulating signal transducer with metallopeptidase domain
VVALFGYGCLIALLLALAARIGEHWLSRRQWAQRWVWLAALSASLLLPASVVWLTPASSRPVTQAAAGVAPAQAISTLTIQDPAPSKSAPFDARPATHSASLQRLDELLQWLWVGVSSALAVLLGTGFWRLRRRLRHLPKIDIDGVEVCIAETLGPAVFGIWRPQIILPRWLLEGPEATRSMVLLHERAHLQARDPLLLIAALSLTVLLPWNLPLWWQLRRLRFAIEVDCDRRVLRAGIDITSYGETLLLVGQHVGHTPFGAMAFTAPQSQLERRIRIMTGGIVRHRVRLLLACGAVSLSLVAAATQIAPPTQLLALAAPAPRLVSSASNLPPAAPPQLPAAASATKTQPAAAVPTPALSNELAAPPSVPLRNYSSSAAVPAARSAERTAAIDARSPRQVRIEAQVVLGNDTFKRRLGLGPESWVRTIVSLDLAAELQQALANDEIVIVTQPVLLATNQLEAILSQPAQMSYEEFSIDDELVVQPRKLLFNFVATPRITSNDGVMLDLMLSIEHVDRMIRNAAGTVIPGTDISSTNMEELLQPGQWLVMEWHRRDGLSRSNPKMGDKERLFIFITARALRPGRRS